MHFSFNLLLSKHNPIKSKLRMLDKQVSILFSLMFYSYDWSDIKETIVKKVPKFEHLWLGFTV
tara:strand:+ start:2029 stop:2217 length:189 start_codon:yes stop_codon:yes gene_type:complete